MKFSSVECPVGLMAVLMIFLPACSNGTNAANPLTIGVVQTAQQSPCAIHAGVSQTCIRSSDGTASCWGNNRHGRLGIGNRDDQWQPTKLVDLDSVTALTVGDAHSCAEKKDGSVSCWGYRYGGSVGPDLDVPRTVTGIGNVTAGYWHNCTIKEDKGVACWGLNQWGQLGSGSEDQESRTPVSVPELEQVEGLALGGVHSCAWTSTGEVYCWGRNDHGQLGDKTQQDRRTPVQVSGLKNVVHVSAGFRHNCALLSDRTVSCWGQGYSGKLGNGSDQMQTSPEPVADLTGVVGLDLGGNHSCALVEDGSS